jgi:hypothetical protein
MGGGTKSHFTYGKFQNPVADYQHKNYLAPTPPLPACSRPRPVETTPSADNAPSAKKILTEVRKILDPPLKWRSLIVQSADMHVSAFYASSVQLGTRLDTWDTCIYIPWTCFHQDMWYNTVTQRTQSCAELNVARVLKRPQGKWALHYR